MKSELNFEQAFNALPAFTCSKSTIKLPQQICSKFTIKTPGRRQWRRSGVFIASFEQIFHNAVMFLSLILDKYIPAGALVRWKFSLRSCSFLRIPCEDDFDASNFKIMIVNKFTNQIYFLNWDERVASDLFQIPHVDTHNTHYTECLQTTVSEQKFNFH